MDEQTLSIAGDVLTVLSFVAAVAAMLFLRKTKKIVQEKSKIETDLRNHVISLQGIFKNVSDGISSVLKDILVLKGIREILNGEMTDVEKKSIIDFVQNNTQLLILQGGIAGSIPININRLNETISELEKAETRHNQIEFIANVFAWITGGSTFLLVAVKVIL